MTRSEAKEFIQAVVAMRELATDTQALAAPFVYPRWKEDTKYALNQRVLYNGILYKVLQEHTSQADWTPDSAASLFAKVLIPDGEKIYPWEQPNSTNTYKVGDKVTHKGKTWISTVPNNSWEPGVYGWEEVL